jgi:hypothetical protein
MATQSTRISTFNDETFLSSDVTKARARNEETAQRLALVAMRNWERALTGVVAIPAAAALSTAAAAMFAASLLERTFEMLESTVADLGRRVGDDFDAHGDPRDGVSRRSAPSVEARS